MKALLPLTLTFGLAVPVFAAPSDANVIVAPRPSSQLVEGTSAANRYGKVFSVTGQLLGVGPGIASNTGLTMGYHLNRNQLIQIEAMQGSITSGLDSSATRTQTFGAHFKHFVGNSFYYRAGVDHARVNYNAVYSRLTQSVNGVMTTQEEASGRFAGHTTGATLVIGNQWQWDNFTLGCDWVGLTQPLVTQVTSQSVTEGRFLSDRAADRLKEDQDDYLRGSLPHLVRLYMGATF